MPLSVRCPSPILGVFIPLSSASLFVSEVLYSHLAWLHICGYPVYKDRKTALFMQQSFAQQLFTLRSTCRNSKPFSHAKERNTLVVPSVDNCMLLITCCHPVCSHKDGCCSALVVAPYTISQFTHFLAICVAKDKSVTELCL